MPKLDAIALEKELAAGTLRPLYVLAGDESYLAHGALASLKAKLGAEENSESTWQVSARDAKADAVIGALRTVPLLGGRPLVIVREGELLTKEGQKALLEALTSYAEAPLDSATLVVMAEKLDGRTRFMGLAAKQGAVVECKKLFDDKVPSWVGVEVRKRGRQISHEAARFLAEMVGNELGQIAQAIDRLLLYVGDKRAIELRDVEEAVAETRQRDVFDLTDAVGRRNLARALSYLHNLLENGQAPPLIVHMLARHFRILAKAKEIAGRGADRAEVASYLGVNPFYASNYVEQARNFSKGELRGSFAILHRCDREVKSSRLPRERILERAIVALTEKRS
jgi:DNA polymerase III subunit delta